jgi:hypothetical protein
MVKGEKRFLDYVNRFETDLSSLRLILEAEPDADRPQEVAIWRDAAGHCLWRTAYFLKNVISMIVEDERLIQSNYEGFEALERVFRRIGALTQEQFLRFGELFTDSEILRLNLKALTHELEEGPLRAEKELSIIHDYETARKNLNDHYALLVDFAAILTGGEELPDAR